MNASIQGITSSVTVEALNEIKIEMAFRDQVSSTKIWLEDLPQRVVSTFD